MNVAGALAIRDGDRERLESLARSSSLTRRAMIVLLAADGFANTEIARRVGTSRPTVLKWRHRYEARGIAGLVDEPRSGRPTTIDEVEVLGETLADGGRPPARLGLAQWSARSMADRLGVSFASVARIWRKYDIRPNHVRGFTFDTHPELDARIHEVVAVYLSPSVRAVIVSVGQQSAPRMRDRRDRAQGPRHSADERRAREYVRCGAAGLFTALETAVERIAAGDHIPSDTHAEFIDVMQKASAVHSHTWLRVVCDDYAIHTLPDVRAWCDARPNVSLHVAPAGRAWLTVAGICISVANRQAIRRGMYDHAAALEVAMCAYVDADDCRTGPFTWLNNANNDAGISECKPINNTKIGAPNINGNVNRAIAGR